MAQAQLTFVVAAHSKLSPAQPLSPKVSKAMNDFPSGSVCSICIPSGPLSLCRCGTDAVPTRKTLPKNFDVAGTEQRLYDWYEEAYVLLPFGLHIAEQACLSVPCIQQASSQLVTWQVGAKWHVPAKKHRLWRALLHGYATPKCDWQAAHGSCNVCHLARHHDALCQDV